MLLHVRSEFCGVIYYTLVNISIMLLIIFKINCHSALTESQSIILNPYSVNLTPFITEHRMIN